MTTQAQAVIARFGGAVKLAELMGVEPSTVYRWTYARTDGGTGGLIPSHRLKQIVELGLVQSPAIVLTVSDLYPR